MSDRLLPVGSSALEVAAAEACAELENVPVPLRQLWDPLTCPAKFLPYLGGRCRLTAGMKTGLSPQSAASFSRHGLFTARKEPSVPSGAWWSRSAT